jgi:hypothetical protein
MNDVEVRPSTIEGLGIFATRPFHPGEHMVDERLNRLAKDPFNSTRHNLLFGITLNTGAFNSERLITLLP